MFKFIREFSDPINALLRNDNSDDLGEDRTDDWNKVCDSSCRGD